MNTPTRREMRWFVSSLIEIRDNTNITPNHIADINFPYAKILEQKGKIFSTEINNNDTAKNKIIGMLSLIKKDNEFLSKFNNFNERLLKWKILTSAVNIIGYQRGLLDFYLKENILKGERVFSLTTNKKGQNVIAVYGENTNKRLESEEQFRAFSYFISNPKKQIGYLELFKELKRGRLHDSNYYDVLYPTDKEKIKFVQTHVYNLKRKLFVIGQKYNIDIDKVLKTFPKDGYIYDDGVTTI